MTRNFRSAPLYWCPTPAALSDPDNGIKDAPHYLGLVCSALENVTRFKHASNDPFSVRLSWLCAEVTAQSAKHFLLQVMHYTDPKEDVPFLDFYNSVMLGINRGQVSPRTEVRITETMSDESLFTPVRSEMVNVIENHFLSTLDNNPGYATPAALSTINAWWFIFTSLKSNVLQNKSTYPVLSGIIRITEHAMFTAFQTDMAIERSQGFPTDPVKSHFHFLCRELQPVLSYLEKEYTALSETAHIIPLIAHPIPHGIILDRPYHHPLAHIRAMNSFYKSYQRPCLQRVHRPLPKAAP